MDTIFEIAQIKQVAQLLWKEGKEKTVWAFYAPMGAGKTTLIHALCDELGVKDAVGSPTFAIINEYQSTVAGMIYHMDWYRLKNEEEAQRAGVEDCLYSGNLCLVEWPRMQRDYYRKASSRYILRYWMQIPGGFTQIPKLFDLNKVVLEDKYRRDGETGRNAE